MVIIRKKNDGGRFVIKRIYLPELCDFFLGMRQRERWKICRCSSFYRN